MYIREGNQKQGRSRERERQIQSESEKGILGMNSAIHFAFGKNVLSNYMFYCKMSKITLVST